jgi:hypothetical protein
LGDFNANVHDFDSDDNIWLANNPTTSDLVIMNKTTGKWQYKYGNVANNNTDIKRKLMI